MASIQRAEGARNERRPFPHSMRTFFQCATVSLLILFGQLAAASGSENGVEAIERVRIDVEDTRTRIGIASVRLKISELKIEEGRVVGQYELRIPLLQSKDDDGMIDLGFQQDLSTTFTTGGKLKGKGISITFKEDAPRTITCVIFPDFATTESGRIHLTIETSDRKIEFKSRYSIRRVDTDAE